MAPRRVDRPSTLHRAADELVADLERWLAERPRHREQFTCACCGYGITVSRLPERCPMCGAADWNRAAAGGGLPLVD